MRLSKFLRNDYRTYKDNIAFFLGNGINNYAGTATSWHNLLVDLAKKHIGTGDDYSSMLKDKSVTYPEFFDIVQLASNEHDETFDYKSIKRGFKEAFSAWEPHDRHKVWTKKIIELNRPLLTTNYDFLFEQSNDGIVNFMREKQRIKKLFRPLRFGEKKARAGFTPYYPWHNYYSNKEITDAKSQFAIWHIHGFNEYPSSIRLGLSDYMGMVGKASRWLHKLKGNPFYELENKDKWVGKNSWLDIFINNHLLFIGIDMGSQETALRWLLIEREKLYRMHPTLRKKAWYVVKDYSQMKSGKRLFFEKLNVEIVKADHYHQMYITMPKLL